MPDTEEDGSMKLFERAVPIISFAFIVIGGIWFAGGQWQDMKSSINALRTDMGDVKQAVSEIKSEQSSVRVDLAAVTADAEKEKSEKERPSKRTPVLAPEWTLPRLGEAP